MNPDNDKIYEFEGNYYQTPTSMQDDIMSFVGSLRDTIGSNTSNIARQTENLGTNIPSNLGGLGGSDSYFAQRYQTTPVESQISTLRATAQADALNKLMKNEVAQAKQRYNKAYKSYQKRTSPNGNTGVNPDLSSYLKALGVVTNPGLSNELDVNDGSGYGRPHTIESDANGNLYYVYENFASPTYGYNRLPIYQTTVADNNALIRLGSSASSGTMKTIDGVDYIYLDVGQDRPGWYRYGTAQHVPGVE